jgi:hypothetical protein
MASVFRHPLATRFAAPAVLVAALAQPHANLLASTLQPVPAAQEQTVPTRRTPLVPCDAPNLLLTTLARPGTPFVPMAFPNPTLAIWTVRPLHYRPTSAAPIARVPFPFGAVYDTPVLLQYPTALRTFLHPYDAFLVPTPAGMLPPGIDDFPNPIRANSPVNGTFLQSRNMLLADTLYGAAGEPPSYQPPQNPLIAARPIGNLTATNDLIRTTLAPLQVRPFSQTVWPQPPGAAFPTALRTWVSYVVGDDSAPFVQGDWPNPTLAPSTAGQKSFTFNAQVFLSAPAAVQPFNATDWPNPLGARYPSDLRTHTDHFALARQEVAPLRQSDWPNPIPARAAIDLRTHLQPVVLVLLGTDHLPCAQHDWPNPIPARAVIDLRTHLQPRNYAEPPFNPVWTILANKYVGLGPTAGEPT